VELLLVQHLTVSLPLFLVIDSHTKNHKLWPVPKMLKSNSSSSSSSSSKWQFAALRIKNHVRQHPIPFPLGLILWHTSGILAAITRKGKRSAKQKSSKTCELQNT
jgi:hypothetical protein